MSIKFGTVKVNTVDECRHLKSRKKLNYGRIETTKRPLDYLKTRR